VRSLSRSNDRTQRHDAADIWHSVGGKMAGDPRLGQCCNPDTRIGHPRPFVISGAYNWAGAHSEVSRGGLRRKCCEVLLDGHAPARFVLLERASPGLGVCGLPAYLSNAMPGNDFHVLRGAAAYPNSSPDWSATVMIIRVKATARPV
jgi:hypothetical protein